MMKKITAYIFILMASIVLLAHAAVPHHHHKTQVCIENKHCDNDSKAHKPDATTHNHEHDGETGSDFCILKQLVLLPSNHNEQLCKYAPITDGHSPLDGFQAIVLKNEFCLFEAYFASNHEVSLITSSYPLLVNSSLGLRAPPSV